MTQRLMYEKSESKTIFKDEKIELGWGDTSKGIRRTLRITWNPDIHTLKEAKLTVTAKPSDDEHNFDVYIDGNLVIHMKWDIFDTASKTESRDVTELIRNGDNIFECVFSKYYWFPMGVNLIFTEILDLVWEIQEGEKPPDSTKETYYGLTTFEWSMLGLAVGSVSIGGIVLITREKK